MKSSVFILHSLAYIILRIYDGRKRRVIHMTSIVTAIRTVLDCRCKCAHPLFTKPLKAVAMEPIVTRTQVTIVISCLNRCCTRRAPVDPPIWVISRYRTRAVVPAKATTLPKKLKRVDRSHSLLRNRELHIHIVSTNRS